MPGANPPIFLIIAGPNGSGKSRAYQDADVEDFIHSVWIINPDVLTAKIREAEGLGLDAANLEAVKRIETWLDATLDAHQTVGVETVLSTEKYRRLVLKAKKLGFLVRLIYVVLDSPARNIERVKLRVQKGGHDVAPAKIIERYGRSLDQLPWFLDQADQASIFDNSGAVPRLIAKKESGTIVLDKDALPSIVAAVEKIRTA